MLGPGVTPLNTPGLREPRGVHGEAHGPVAGLASTSVGAGAGPSEALSLALVGVLRAGAARANYLALDRPGVAFAAKELRRRMSAPCAGDLPALRRLARYLLGAPWRVDNFSTQHLAGLDVYVDTDWAGRGQYEAQRVRLVCHAGARAS